MKTTSQIFVKRWFDKINGNSYFNYYISISDELGAIQRINAPYKLEYGYGSHPFYRALEEMKKAGYDTDKMEIEHIDYGY